MKERERNKYNEQSHNQGGIFCAVSSFYKSRSWGGGGGGGGLVVVVGGVGCFFSFFGFILFFST